ncbi:MAG: tRNA 4-thiouridine(8) synthase ThiI [SAR324 cluster bacterium]|uniref:Probable tRNA sulfurtransferase n=1 Tax=SAR324 cluster bacterium TaxID=2024889 RepID=A0A2A4SSJ6_9DELT|nr:MAG: tRNA 4-thiouridine(8) synthase ThiI [SAR324 cluster bacterium]
MQFIVVRYAEIALKGGNRDWFEKMLINNIRKHLKKIGWTRVTKIHGRIMVEVEGEQDRISEIMRNIPGIANFSYATSCDHNMETIGKAGVELLKTYFEQNNKSSISFRVYAKRSSKDFPMNSPKLAGELGGMMLDQFPQLQVQLKNPELTLGIEIWHNERSIVYLEKIQGMGGLPVGSSGNVISFLSGGIDSPVASCMMMRRGCKTIFLNFHSYPFIGEQSREKVIDLVTHLSRYQPKTTLIIAPFTKIQKAIKDNCREKYRTILYRRMMYLIAERIIGRYRVSAYVTGEAVGQVASQTLKNLACTEAAASLPVLRPLIGMDKSDIIERAKEIGTYPISIQPFPDCCTVFQPKKPETQGKLELVVGEEERFDFESLIDEAVENLEIITMESSIQEKFWD